MSSVIMPNKNNVLIFSEHKTIHKQYKNNKSSMGAGSPFLLNNVKNTLMGGMVQPKIKPLVFSKKNIKPINFLI